MVYRSSIGGIYYRQQSTGRTTQSITYNVVDMEGLITYGWDGTTQSITYNVVDTEGPTTYGWDRQVVEGYLNGENYTTHRI